jgi:hypothetical protein
MGQKRSSVATYRYARGDISYLSFSGFNSDLDVFAKISSRVEAEGKGERSKLDLESPTNMYKGNHG